MVDDDRGDILGEGNVEIKDSKVLPGELYRIGALQAGPFFAFYCYGRTTLNYWKFFS